MSTESIPCSPLRVLHPPVEKPTPEYMSKKKSKGTSPSIVKSLRNKENILLGNVRKRHIDPIRSIIKSIPDEFIAYGGNPITNRVIQYRKENGITDGRNIALVTYGPSKSDPTAGYTIAVTKGYMKEHSEIKACDKLPSPVRREPDRVRTIYTERSACRGPGKRCCFDRISALFPHAAFKHSFPNDRMARAGINEKMNEVPMVEEHPPLDCYRACRRSSTFTSLKFTQAPAFGGGSANYRIISMAKTNAKRANDSRTPSDAMHNPKSAGFLAVA